MIVDKLRADLKSGRGGGGKVSFFKNGKPSGGNGGDGGDVYLVGSSNLYDLKSLKKEKVYKAEDGESGADNQMLGKNGEDMIVKVPLTTVVYDLENKELFRITKEGERKKVLEGGRGGRGNHDFRRGQVATLRKFTPGKPGDELKVFLELRLSADVIFIGFPNAGKSSMLNALTNASAAVAAYPFTTLQPHLGVVEDLILMDLPGLIEGTSEGKGLGTHFVKHTKNAKLVAHFVSMEDEDMVDRYERMRAELKDIDEKLYEKPEMIVLSKSDMFEDEEIKEKIALFEKFGKKVVTTSAFIRDNYEILVNEFREGIGE